MTDQQGSKHIAVMLPQVLRELNVHAGGDFLDCTLGGAGHTTGILAANEKNTVLALDRDRRALERAQRKLAGFGGRVNFNQAAFSELPQVCQERKFDGVLADLGISTDQLHEGRGFSFNDDAPLDMRMDESQPLTAAELVNTSAFEELFAILKRGGVGREARSVARAIVTARPIKTTRDLAQIVQKAARGLTSKTKIHPATVTFQAIRMAVNGELEEIEALLNFVPQVVKSGARLAVITFHSLEDKLVTRQMRDWEGADTAPAWWPGRKAGNTSIGSMVARSAIKPDEEEVCGNPSARSARLRVFEFGAVGR